MLKFATTAGVNVLLYIPIHIGMPLNSTDIKLINIRFLAFYCQVTTSSEPL